MSRTMSKKHVLASIAAAGVLGVGIAAPTMAFANDPSPSPSASADAGTDREQRHADRQAEFAEALAKELGVDTDKVTAALEKLREEHQGDRPEWPGKGERGERGEKGERGGDAADRQEKLKERLATAVEEGKLTQEQADAITKAVESGVFPGGGGPGRGGHPGAGADKTGE
ncbi:hypothetical protein [Micromonospora yangpuensis]|uniref:Uncharacterized protein n=1 Tax=Micromonospora yangpuensis TaxID=683228 RepID=A0A1C6V1A0_9ACTN|nr:hypothetical protein [Micromonospora yangpuensis]GGL97560.1 hypothetical protein GCM10012279_13800 [Micromonospora yangpuensis]SCL60088.1 hypothetical protein GA0070617_4277 [Micromonospora yangpuensis]